MNGMLRRRICTLRGIFESVIPNLPTGQAGVAEGFSSRVWFVFAHHDTLQFFITPKNSSNR